MKTPKQRKPKFGPLTFRVVGDPSHYDSRTTVEGGDDGEVTIQVGGRANIETLEQITASICEALNQPEGQSSMQPAQTICSDCGSPQFHTPSGITCVNGHGGAPPAVSPSHPEQRRIVEWVRMAANHAFPNEEDWPDAWLWTGHGPHHDLPDPDNDIAPSWSFWDSDELLLGLPVYHHNTWLKHGGHYGEHQWIVPLWFRDPSDKERLTHIFLQEIAEGRPE